MKRVLFILSAIALLTSSCNNEGCNQPYAFNYDPEGTSEENCVYGPIELEVEFQPVFGETELEQGNLADQSFTTADGRTLSFSYFGIYFTEFAARINGSYDFLDQGVDDCVNRRTDAFLLDSEHWTYSTTILPDADFSLDGLKFNIGVDSCRNYRLDPSTQTDGPFKPQVNSMYWTWASGYRFIRLDGSVDSSVDADGSVTSDFEYHTGVDALLRTVEFSFENLTVDNGKLRLIMQVDLEQMLNGLDFTTDLVTHTMNNMPLAMKITENATTSITIKEDN